MEKWNRFTNLVKDQFTYGGKKYALSTTKESTDCLFDTYGYTWLLGTIHKYIYRYNNLARERDLLKIACYMYIMWLKRGFHIETQGTNQVIDTTVDTKDKYFNSFIEKVDEGTFVDNEKSGLPRVDDILSTWAGEGWFKISEERIVEVFIQIFNVWAEKYGDVEVHDTDVNNEEKLRK